LCARTIGNWIAGTITNRGRALPSQERSSEKKLAVACRFATTFVEKKAHHSGNPLLPAARIGLAQAVALQQAFAALAPQFLSPSTPGRDRFWLPFGPEDPTADFDLFACSPVCP
jgi:hypothetical protein